MKTISKKIINFLMVTSLIVILPVHSNATAHTSPTTIVTEHTDISEEDVMIKRLYEIEEMNKSDLSRAEKKALRQEVKTIKKSDNNNHEGVYISAGGVLLIVLLLIILL